jgi:hypothetical protein
VDLSPLFPTPLQRQLKLFVLKTRKGSTSMSQTNIGYMRLVEKSPYRIWEVRDKDGKLLERGDCIGCTITAARYDMRVLTVH